MKAVSLDGKGHVFITDKPIPLLKPGYVLVKVMAAGICGTDIELLYHSEHPPVSIPGHEVAGIVVDTGDCMSVHVGERVFLNCHITCMQCANCQAGDYIFCDDLQVMGFDVDGGDAEYVAIPEVNLRHLPDDLTFEQGVLLTDALGTPFHAANKARIQPGDFVGIFGAGPLGIMCILSVLHFGGIPIAVDVLDERLMQAKSFGAAEVVNGNNDSKAAILSATNGKGLDKAIDCSGNAAAIRTALQTLRNRGTLIQVGVCTKVELNLFDEIIAKELSVIGSRNFQDQELPEMIELIRGTPKINNVFTHRLPFDDAQIAFETAAKREGLKIILCPDEGGQSN